MRLAVRPLDLAVLLDVSTGPAIFFFTLMPVAISTAPRDRPVAVRREAVEGPVVVVFGRRWHRERVKRAGRVLDRQQDHQTLNLVLTQPEADGRNDGLGSLWRGTGVQGT